MTSWFRNGRTLPVSKDRDQWAPAFLKCPWEANSLIPGFFSQSCCCCIGLILQGSSQGCNWAKMSAGGAGRKYKLSQISSPTRRRETSGAAILKESAHRRLMGKVAGSEQLRESEESLTEKCSPQVRHQTRTLWASDPSPPTDNEQKMIWNDMRGMKRVKKMKPRRVEIRSARCLEITAVSHIIPCEPFVFNLEKVF